MHQGWTTFPLLLGPSEQYNFTVVKEVPFPLSFHTFEKIPSPPPPSWVFIFLKIVAFVATNHEQFLTFSTKDSQVIWENQASDGGGSSPVTPSPCCQFHYQGCLLGSDTVRVPHWARPRSQDNEGLPQSASTKRVCLWLPLSPESRDRRLCALHSPLVCRASQVICKWHGSSGVIYLEKCQCV